MKALKDDVFNRPAPIGYEVREIEGASFSTTYLYTIEKPDGSLVAHYVVVFRGKDVALYESNRGKTGDEIKETLNDIGL